MSLSWGTRTQPPATTGLGALHLDYPGALERLLSLVDHERMRGHPPAPPRPDLRRVEALLERLGNPHRQVPGVHVAGTKGKGSTAAMLTFALSALGYPTGLFTSPHLHTFRERLRLNGHPVTEEKFAELVERTWPAVQAVNQEGVHGSITTFELLTAMAFLLFRLEECRWAVMEVGLGGRLDSTNVLEPEVAVITSISLDHTTILGKSVERIAWEKAGIIKRGATVVCAPQAPEAREVFRAVSRKRGATLVYVPEHYVWERTASSLEGQAFTVQGPARTYRLWMPLLGHHQLENAATALGTLESLESRGLALDLEALAEGFRRLEWPARMEVLAQEPLLVADGAHNPYSLRRLGESLREYLTFEELVLVTGWGTDKDQEAMARELARLRPRSVVATRSRHPRALAPESVAGVLRRHGAPVAAEHPTVGEAVREALALARHRDLILVTGSLFVAAEAREAIWDIAPEVYPDLSP